MKHKRRKILYGIIFMLLLLTASSNTILKLKIPYKLNSESFEEKQQIIEQQLNYQSDKLDSIIIQIKNKK